VITVVLVFIGGALVTAVAGAIGAEAQGWLELAPRGALWLAARRLPVDQRKSVYEKEWVPELLAILQEADGRPITRLVVGITYAVSMARGAGEVAHELHGVREYEPETVVYVQDADEGQFTDGRYENGYDHLFGGTAASMEYPTAAAHFEIGTAASMSSAKGNLEYPTAAAHLEIRTEPWPKT
jgi:hypothetical protein